MWVLFWCNQLQFEEQCFVWPDVQLQFTEDTIDYIVQKALDLKLGARGLRSICEAIVMDAMFEIPSQKKMKKLVLDKAYVMERLDKSKLAMLKVA